MTILFNDAWKEYSRKLFLHYGEDALESVRVGWDMAQEYFTEPKEEEILYHYRAEILENGKVVSGIDGIFNPPEVFKRNDYKKLKNTLRSTYNISQHQEIVITSFSRL